MTCHGLREATEVSYFSAVIPACRQSGVHDRVSRTFARLSKLVHRRRVIY